MNDVIGSDWGFLRRPALFSPAVGFLTFLAVEAANSPTELRTGGLREILIGGLIGLPLALVIATLFALIPLLIGGATLLAACRLLPSRWIEILPFRLTIGGLVGVLVGWPFTHVLNWIPSATAEPRFNHTSMFIACAVTGAYCAVFYSPPPLSANQSEEGKWP
jgi:hypothetical protein